MIFFFFFNSRFVHLSRSCPLCVFFFFDMCYCTQQDDRAVFLLQPFVKSRFHFCSYDVTSFAHWSWVWWAVGVVFNPAPHHPHAGVVVRRRMFLLRLDLFVKSFLLEGHAQNGRSPYRMPINECLCKCGSRSRVSWMFTIVVIYIYIYKKEIKLI